MVEEELILAIGRLERAISRSEHALTKLHLSDAGQSISGKEQKLKLAIQDAIGVIDDILEHRP